MTYHLCCVACGATYIDDGVRLACAGSHGPALLRTEYAWRTLEPYAGVSGPDRFRNWLPVRRAIIGTAEPALFQSPRLAAELGLRQLWLAFSGYWPERGATMPTGTFKDLEALTVLGRLPDEPGVLVVASAGNTAAAFAVACSVQRQPCLIVVPARALRTMRLPAGLDPCVRVVALDEPADYTDVIAFADRIAATPGFVPEGGTRNVARRDGLGTVLLSAIERIGRMPDHYVQAIGSGAGALGVHEMAQRLAVGGDPSTPPRLTLVQNLPFAPVFRSWQAGHGRLEALGDPSAAIAATFAGELTNRQPPYAIAGGLHDALVQSDGSVDAVDGADARAARAAFGDYEGYDIEPAAAVALAGLRRRCRAGAIARDAAVLLHLTGGGRARLAVDTAAGPVSAALRVPYADGSVDEALERVRDLFDVPGLTLASRHDATTGSAQ